jgi:hypothetical protein
MTTNEVLTLIALVGGPISAVLITRYLDDLRQYRARRMDVFRTLMRTRRTALHPDHIGALNLVEIEYANDPQVLTAWKALFTNFGSTLGRLEVERTEGLTDQKQIDARNQAFGTRAVQERQKLLAKLLHAMARVLGFKIEQLEIFEGGYTPQLWANVENDQEVIRKYVVELAHGRATVPMAVIDYRVAPSAAGASTGASTTKIASDRG